MKLTNRQANAIALNIYKEAIEPLKNKYNEERKKVVDKVTITKEERKIIDNYVKSNNLVSNLQKSYSATSWQYKKPTTIKEELDKFLDLKKTKIKSDYKEHNLPTLTEVEDQVMLSLIDATELSDIIKAVKQKYNLK